MLARIALVLVLALTTACASVAPGRDSAPGVERIAIPFEYAGLGVGGNPTLGLVELPKGGEAKVISRAIVLALQELELSVSHLSPTEPLPPGQRWETDDAEIPLATVDSYNRRVDPRLRLDKAYYRRRYIGEYAIDKNVLTFTLEVKLSAGGRAGAPQPYTRDYSGRFFSEELVRLIQDKLKSATPR